MVIVEETTQVVSVEELRSQAVRQLVGAHVPAIDQGALESLESASSYAEVINGMAAVLRSVRDNEERAVVSCWLDSIKEEAIRQLARIEQEYAASTSLEVLRDRAIGLLRGGMVLWRPSLRKVSTYDELGAWLDNIGTHADIALVEPISESAERLRQLRDIVRTKIA